MKRTCGFLASAGVVFALVTPAFGQGRDPGLRLPVEPPPTVLTTAPLFATSMYLLAGGEIIFSTGNQFCNVVNVGKHPLTITISLIESSAGPTVIDAITRVVAPGAGEQLQGTSIGASNGLAQYCKFSFKGGSKEDVRGLLQQTYYFNGYFFPGPVTEAR